jgi:hypothetical protein
MVGWGLPFQGVTIITSKTARKGKGEKGTVLIIFCHFKLVEHLNK